MEPAIIFRAPTSRMYAVVTWVIAGVILFSFAATDGVSALVSYGALPLLLGVLGWAAFWRPLVRIEREGVRVVNVLSTSWLPWQTITGTRTRWGLEITTHHGRSVGAWALPSRSSLGRWSSRGQQPAPPPALSRLTSDVPGGYDPLVAAAIIDKHRTGHRVAAHAAPPPQRRPEIVAAGLLVATAGLAAASLLL